MSALAAQARTELRLSLRNGEQLLVTLGIPVLVLVFFSLVDVLPIDDTAMPGLSTPAELGGLVTEVRAVDALFPRVLALAVMSSAMVALGIGTGFERHYKVLKRLGTTPLGRPRLLAAKTASTVAILVVQAVVLTAAALALGWRPGRFEASLAPQVALAVLACVLGTAAFAGIGLLLAGTLSGPLNLAACNGLYLVLLLFGGIVVPVTELPGPLEAVGSALPSGALAQVLDHALTLGEASPALAWLILATWAIVAPLAAARWFRWE